MERIEWDQKCSVGVDEIDAQHKDFVKIIGRIQKGFASKYPADLILRMVLELQKYAEYHFLSEENLMLLFGYPRRQAHEVEHHKLLETLHIHISKLKNAYPDPSSFLRFVYEWFVTHTSREDKVFGEFILNKAKTLKPS